MSHIQKKLDELKNIFTATDEVLDSWKSKDENLQVPALIGLLAVRLNWSEADIRNHDPVVRSYLRTHEVWEVIRGAHGGIVKRVERKNKATEKSIKAAVRAQMKAAIEAHLAAEEESANDVLEVDEEAEDLE